MFLGRDYRFVFLNSLGQTIAAAGIVIKGRRWKMAGGVQAWEAAEAAIASNGSTVANGAYFATAAIPNDADAYLGGSFEITVTAPSSSSGTVTAWLQRSTDGGASWPDDGAGSLIKTFSFASAGTKTDVVEV